MSPSVPYRVVRLRRMMSLEFCGRNLYNYVSEDERILSVKKSLALALWALQEKGEGRERERKALI